MSRVPGTEHLGRRDLLVVAWHHIPELFGMLPPTHQWELHSFYAPSRDLTDDEVLDHLTRAKAREPSLSSRAGKHYKQAFDAFKFYADQVGKTEWELIGQLLRMEYVRDHATLTGTKRLAAIVLVRPEPDLQMFSRALLALLDHERETGENAGLCQPAGACKTGTVPS